MLIVEAQARKDDVERNVDSALRPSPTSFIPIVTMSLSTSSARGLFGAAGRLSCRSCRTFSTTRSTLNSSSANSSKDPNHPNLWYHTLPDTLPPRIALSFLPTPPQYGSRTVLGYLPVNSAAGLRDFKEEPRFLYVAP
jgi:hypothetical protein